MLQSLHIDIHFGRKAGYDKKTNKQKKQIYVFLLSKPFENIEMRVKYMNGCEKWL